MKYKLFAIDLDGTLLSKTKHISDKNLQGIKKYIELGGMPIITTGRSIVSSQKFVNQIDNYTKHKSAYIVSFNGAHILNLKNNEVKCFIIPGKLAAKIMEYAFTNKLHFWIYTKESTRRNGVFINESKSRLRLRIIEKLVAFLLKSIHMLPLENNPLDCYKINLSSYHKESVKKAYEWLKNEFKDQINISFTSRYLMEINMIGVNKGSAIKYIANEEKVSQDHIAAIGDSNNDLSAFEAAGLKIAVKSKSQKLIDASNYYLPYKKDVVADAINKYVINENKISLIASDLDGTLLSNDDKSVVPVAKEAILKAVNEKKIKFAISTGRGIDDAIKVLQDIGFRNYHDLFIVGTNGSSIYDLEKNSYLFNAFVENKDLINIYKDILSIATDKYRKGEIGVQIFVKEDEKLIGAKPQTEYWYNRKFLESIWLSKNRFMFTNSWQTKNIKEEINVNQIQQVLKLIVICENQEDLARVRGILEQKQYYVDVTSSSHSNLEIIPKNCSKGNALKRLCEYLKISPETIATIGDQKNDISMFDITPNSFTLATSLESVKEHAKNIINKKASFVVADVINRYIK